MIPHSASQVETQDFAFIAGVVERNFVGRGPLCADLERELGLRFGRAHVTLCNSGTAALHLALVALKQHAPAGARVLLGAYGCPEVVSAVLRAGLQPHFVDIAPGTLNMDMQAARAQVDERALAILCTHIGGRPDDLAAAAALGLPVISDCAQGVGSRIGAEDVASAGICSILSFGATKMLTVGSGGAVLSGDATLGARIAHLARAELSVEEYRREGLVPRFGQHVGELTAGLALAQLRKLDVSIERRREIAAAYDTALAPHPDAQAPGEQLVRLNRFRYYFMTSRADAWLAHLRSNGIDARRSISHALPDYVGRLDAFSGLARALRQVVSVPVYPAMTASQVHTVAAALAAGPDGH